MSFRKYVLSIAAAGSLLAATQVDAASIFLSPISTPPANSDTATGVVVDLNPTITYGSLGSKTLGIWVTDEVLVNRGLSMSITTSNNTAAPLTGAQALNFQVHNIANFGAGEFDAGDTGTNRWGSVGTGSLQAGGTAINNLNAATVNDGRGINAANNGAPTNPGIDTWDLGYDVPTHAFLYGTVTFNLASLPEGPVIIDLIPSNLGIANNTGDVTGQFSFGQATITVPEPASLGLIALGGLAVLRRRK